jgi:hypothetical protein
MRNFSKHRSVALKDAARDPIDIAQRGSITLEQLVQEAIRTHQDRWSSPE